jgi:DNA-binding response OmpR family regulator
MKRLVLVVDEFEPHAKLAALALGSQGFTALVGFASANAFDLFGVRPIEAAVLDVRLPEQRGLTLPSSPRSVGSAQRRALPRTQRICHR